MMAMGKRRGPKRSGAAAIETALIMIPMLMMFFGIFEYGRLLMDWNMLNNAAREGCRYALVNNTSVTINTQVQSVVKTFIGNEIANYSNFTITVSGTHAGASTPVNNLAAGDLISVTVTGKYKFMNIIPFVTMPTLNMTSTVTMVCEGAT
jgi:Flp pilus assembly protein TadG